MASRPGKTPPDGPTEDEVADFLARNPDFLNRRPELLRQIAPPSRFPEPAPEGAEIVDMQGFMVSRLQQDLARTRDSHDELVQSARSNLTSQTLIHQAVLALIDARDFEELIHTVTHDLPLLLDVDAVSLCIEADGSPASATQGVYVLPVGGVDEALGADRRVILRERAEGTERFFGPAAALVRSDALVRLTPNSHAPVALLALGSRETGRFHPGQGTELLAFLAEVLERCLRQWLNLPAA